MNLLHWVGDWDCCIHVVHETLQVWDGGGDNEKFLARWRPTTISDISSRALWKWQRRGKLLQDFVVVLWCWIAIKFFGQFAQAAGDWMALIPVRRLPTGENWFSRSRQRSHQKSNLFSNLCFQPAPAAKRFVRQFVIRAETGAINSDGCRNSST